MKKLLMVDLMLMAGSSALAVQWTDAHHDGAIRNPIVRVLRTKLEQVTPLCTRHLNGFLKSVNEEQQ